LRLKRARGATARQRARGARRWFPHSLRGGRPRARTISTISSAIHMKLAAATAKAEARRKVWDQNHRHASRMSATAPRRFGSRGGLQAGLVSGNRVGNLARRHRQGKRAMLGGAVEDLAGAGEERHDHDLPERQPAERQHGNLVSKADEACPRRRVCCRQDQQREGHQRDPRAESRHNLATPKEQKVAVATQRNHRPSQDSGSPQSTSHNGSAWGDR
jgi:hypothetical protein